MLGACSFDKCSDVRWNFFRTYGVCHTVRTSGLPVHPGYIWERGTDLMYPLGRVTTHPIGVLGFVARGKNVESYAYGGTRDVLLGDSPRPLLPLPDVLPGVLNRLA